MGNKTLRLGRSDRVTGGLLLVSYPTCHSPIRGHPHTNPLPRQPFSSPPPPRLFRSASASPLATRRTRTRPASLLSAAALFPVHTSPLLRAPVRLPRLVPAGSRPCARGGEWVTWEEETGGRRRRRRPEAGPTTWWSWSTGSSGGTASCSANLPSISSRNWDWARFSIAPPKTYGRTLFS